VAHDTHHLTTPSGCVIPDHAHSGEDWPELKALAQARGFKIP
jgi:hypothetical protein